MGGITYCASRTKGKPRCAKDRVTWLVEHHFCMVTITLIHKEI
jgi:hypothetical protein